MLTEAEVRRNAYYDSVQLMVVSEALRRLPGIKQAMVVMGSENNRQILREIGLATALTDAATANDLIVAFAADGPAALDMGALELERLLAAGVRKEMGREFHRSVAAAAAAVPGANLCLISVPGAYAPMVAEEALAAGLHLLIFSDQVPLAEERRIKELARSKGLLCMGPDCGVANLNGIALLTGSIVRRGPIGIVGASGSGIQQITVIAEREGVGISQAIGTGGRDLKDEVGGLSMLAGIDALEADPQTEVIVLVSRTPGRRTLSAVLDRVGRCMKPVVIHFIGGDTSLIKRTGAVPSGNLEEAASRAIAIVRGQQEDAQPFSLAAGDIDAMVAQACRGMARSQRYLRGLFCGGTFCEEGMAILADLVGEIRSNSPLRPHLRLASSTESVAHSVVDYGEEEFTRGRPHPVIDPEQRRLGILRDGADPEVAVLLLDFILGPAVHRDPAGAVADTIREVRSRAEWEGRSLAIVASVCGTEGDPQRLSRQETILREAGALVMPTNIQAARLAGRIIAHQARRPA
jgi:FdrA protein